MPVPRSGRERKERRRARKLAEAASRTPEAVTTDSQAVQPQETPQPLTPPPEVSPEPGSTGEADARGTGGDTVHLPVPLEPNNTRDTRMVSRAMRERWPISPDIRGKVVRKLAAIVDLSQSRRERIAAARALIAADRQNQVDELATLNRDRDGSPFTPAPMVGVQVNTNGPAQVQFYLPSNGRDPE